MYCPEVVFNELPTKTVSQEKFLSNACNKGRFIAVLSAKLESGGFPAKLATEGAENLIAPSAIAAAVAEERKCAALVEEAIDLLMILTPLASPSRNIFFLETRERKLAE
ncbi:hypothetical protein AVEN_202899-1 [Araneus ventricosus]|uniref:Uncharacterized protein n=1 Tax=Araneus ventricosus TaxID=182803 RepID=A0A4Y2RY39_ARAVE|nr:hypothetical protein AVEN_202899-1 [Araneus ventricosus]